MTSIAAIQSGTLTSPLFYYQKPSFKHLRTSVPINHRVISLDLSTIVDIKSKPNISEIQRVSASATTEVVTEEASTENSTSATPEDSDDPAQKTEKLEVVVKPVVKPRLVLKFIWMTKNIGLGLDQVIPGHGSIPLSPYYFWPRKDAWEELKITLESKPWISQKNMIILLNQATDIINLWQQSGGNLSS